MTVRLIIFYKHLTFEIDVKTADSVKIEKEFFQTLIYNNIL